MAMARAARARSQHLDRVAAALRCQRTLRAWWSRLLGARRGALATACMQRRRACLARWSREARVRGIARRQLAACHDCATAGRRLRCCRRALRQWCDALLGRRRRAMLARVASIHAARARVRSTFLSLRATQRARRRSRLTHAMSLLKLHRRAHWSDRHFWASAVHWHRRSSLAHAWRLWAAFWCARHHQTLPSIDSRPERLAYSLSLAHSLTHPPTHHPPTHPPTHSLTHILTISLAR